MPDDIEHKMLRSRAAFLRPFQVMVYAVFAMIVATACVALVSGYAIKDYTDRIVMVRLIQITFGMILGSSCVVFGVFLSWLGIESSFDVDAQGDMKGGKVKLASTSPGIALIIGGIVLICVALNREVSYSRTVFEEPPKVGGPAT